ncbi:MAG: hypothetical protein COC11_00795, partial [Candidatus Neomarinimicrobiota bacterium]
MGRLKYAVQQLKSKNQLILDNTDRALGLVSLNEAVTTDATRVEMAICVAYNILKKKHKDPVGTAGIDATKWKGVNKSLRKIGTAVAAKLPQTPPKMIHSGSGSSSTHYPTPASDKTPKTDLYAATGKAYYSLKKAGDKGSGARLMSAYPGEANGVFVGAIRHFETNEKTKIAKDEKFIKVFTILKDKMKENQRKNLNVEIG